MKIRKKITSKLLIYILLFSGFVTICVTAIQLYTELNRDLGHIEEYFDRIEKISAPSLARALWEYNEESVNIMLEGIANLGDIEYVEITDEDNRSIFIGKKITEHPLTRHILLAYHTKEKDIEVGRLTVVASKSKIYDRLYSRLIVILLSQGVKTFLVSAFIFFIVHSLVIKHLVFISSFLEKINIKELDATLNLHRDSTAEKDELDQMALSINKMIKRLRSSFFEVENKSAEMSALLIATRSILEQHEFKSTARLIFDHCTKLIGAESGYVALLSDDGEENEVLFLESGGLPCTVDPSLPMPIRGLRAEAYRTGRAQYDNDFGNSEWMKFMPQGHVALKNVLFSPLIIGRKVVGLLGMANKANDFDDNDAHIATAFGELAAIALQNSRNLDSLNEREIELENLNLELDHKVKERTQKLVDASEKIRQSNEELEQRVRERTVSLEQKNVELEKLNKLFVGRELQMVELKKRIKKLEQ